VKLSTSKKKVQSFNLDFDCVVIEGPFVSEVMEDYQRFKSRLGRMKGAKVDQRQTKMRGDAMYAQAEATKTMAAAMMMKAALLED
jgi:hypothetical protein